MAIPAKNILGNPNVTEGSFQIAIEQLRESVIGSGKVYDSANTYMAKDTCEYSGVMYYSKIDNNIGNTPLIGANWGDVADLILGVVHKTGDETIAGIKNFSSSPLLPVPTLANQAISMGNILEKTGVGIGYGIDSCGTVTQLTSKSTAVTLNKPTGRILSHNASLAAGASVSFTVNNSLFSNLDTVILTGKAFSGRYRIENSNSTTGSFDIRITNINSVAYTDALEIDFAVIKGASL